jgi:hypothetical protein
MASPRQQLIIDRLMEDHDPDGALKLLLSFYDDHINQSVAIYGYWSSIRQAICSDDRYRSKHYHQRLASIMEKANQDDYDRLNVLYNAPLKAQHRISIQKKPFLQDRVLDRELKDLKPVKSYMYDFVLPPDIVADAMHQNHLSMIEAQSHQRQPLDSYKMSEAQAIDIIETSIGVLHDPLVEEKDYWKNMVALQILSGRRNYEILMTLNYSRASHPFQANVSGILKKRSFEDVDTETYTIPLLCSYDLFHKAMDRFRDVRDIYGTPKELSSMIGGKLNTACKRLFGRRMTHTQKRNLYSEMAFRRRHTENHYLINDQSCSKSMWIINALAHDVSFSVHERYQTMLIE